MSDLSAIRPLHARAVRLSGDIVANATAADLGRATPCDGWTLADLLAHMIAQHRGFAIAASGALSDVAAWQPRPLAENFVGEYTDAATAVVDAYADADAAGREIWLPELSTARTFTAYDAMTFHFVDYVVHSWDVARSLDVPLHVDRDVADAALVVAERVPTNPARRGPGFAFAPVLPTDPAASPLDRTLTLLGRKPSWPH